MIADRFPDAGSTPRSETLGCLSACLVAITFASLKRVRLGPVRTFLAPALAGAMLLCGPALAIGTRTLDVSTLTMALALIPVVVAVARPAFRHTEGAEVAGRLWPGIAAVAGLLLLLPEPSLDGVRNDLILAAAPILTGISAVWFRGSPAPKPWRAAAGLAAATLFFLAATLSTHSLRAPIPREFALACALDGLLALLSVLALLRTGATRWSAQFVIAPLLVVLEGLAILRPRIDGRMLAGIAVLLFASVFLLLPPRADDPPDLHLTP